MQLAICWSGSSHLHLLKQDSNCSSHIVTPFIDVLFDIIHSRTVLENLLSVIAMVIVTKHILIVAHSSVLLMSPDSPARVLYLR